MHRIVRSILLCFVVIPALAISHSDSEDIATFSEQVQKIAQRLDLSEQQRAQLEPVLEAHFAETQALLEQHGLKQRPDELLGRRQLLALSRAIRPLRERTDRQVEAILTSGQMAEYQHIQRQRRARMRIGFQRWMGE